VSGRPATVDVHLLPVPALLVDSRFRVTHWNRDCELLFGFTESEAAGRRVVDVLTTALHGGAPDEDAKALREELARGDVIRHVAQAKAKDGRVLWCEFIAKPFLEAGAFTGAVAMFFDVTERVVQEELLRASEAQLRSVLLDTPLIAAIADREGRIVLANRATAALAGVGDPADLEGREWDEVFGRYPEDDRYWAEFLAGRVIPTYEGRIRTVHGERRVMWANVLLQTTEVPLSASMGLDVTEERAAQEALSAAQQQLRRLTQDLMTAERLERDRIAEELHDDTVQVLVAGLTQIDRVIAWTGDTPAAEVARSARGMLADATDRTRRLMFDLRPVILEEHGLAAAVAELCASAAADGGFEVTVDVCPGRFGPDVEELAFRTIREALGNAVKHSGARHLAVEVHEEGTMLTGSVTDDGRGFDPSAPRAREPGRLHLGIESMARRITLAEGVFELDSAPGEGTRLRFSIPKGARTRRRAS
jgi:PAS domain S-box-containing protein